jgi:hypothetical protein
MTFQTIYDNLQAVPEGLREHYRELDDGRAVVDLTPINGVQVNVEHMPGLITALDERKSDLKSAKEKLSQFGDLDPVKARDALSSVASMKEHTKGRIEEARAELAAEFEKKLSEVNSERDSYRSQVQDLIVRDAANQAIAKHDGVGALLMPLVENNVFLDKSETGELVVRVKGPNGVARSSPENPHNFMGLEELVAELKGNPDYSGAFKASVAPGTATPGSVVSQNGVSHDSSNNPFKTKDIDRMSAIHRENPALAEQLQAEADRG